ncbi:MAG: D-amino-acid transaminase [Bacteroidales bacterium]|nr:MAG: D-amino-acid transaminase [Bacteroidales bacterium]
MSETVFLNGEFIAREKAYISPEDRGFYFADGVYEVIRCFKGSLFSYEEHIQRLKRSLSETRIKFRDIKSLDSVCKKIISKNNLEGKYADIYIQITRGVHRRMHRFPVEEISPTVYIYAYERLPSVNEMKRGVKVITRNDIRWLRCDIKSVSLLPNTLKFQEAHDENARECIFIRDGVITEASHSNVLGIKTGVVFTHPDSNLILSGITKKVVFRICNDLGIYVKESPIREEEISEFDELFITGTGNDIMPVVQLNDIVINDGVPGTITRQIQREYFRITYKKLGGEKKLWF